jgi:hypothetical protein
MVWKAAAALLTCMSAEMELQVKLMQVPEHLAAHEHRGRQREKTVSSWLENKFAFTFCCTPA